MLTIYNVSVQTKKKKKSIFWKYYQQTATDKFSSKIMYRGYTYKINNFILKRSDRNRNNSTFTLIIVVWILQLIIKFKK